MSTTAYWRNPTESTEHTGVARSATPSSTAILRVIGKSLAFIFITGVFTMSNAATVQETNKALVRGSFERWAHGSGSPFELLLPDADWTIVGSSPLSKTYHGTQSFLDEVIHPFNARMRTPLVPTVRGIYADGDAVITLFDAAATAADGVPYRNTYTWYFFMRDGKVTKAIAFFDTREFDEFWQRVKPK
jgi:uncharacterized protein